MSLFWAAQFMGTCAVILSFWVYQINKRTSMLLLSSAASLIYALQFIFLHAYTGGAMNIVAAVRNYTFYKTRPSKKNIWVLYIFMAVALLGTAITWQGSISLLPLGGNWFNALASWQTSTKWMRRFALLAPPFWIIYSILVRSYPSLAIEVFIFCSNILGQYRFDLKPRLASKKSA